MKNLCKQNWYQITLLFLFCVTVFLRFYKLTVLPDVLHIDEAALGYNSWCLANYGTDRYLNVLPFYPQNFYGGQSPLYTYLVVLLIKFFGKGNLSVFLVRFPAAFASILLWITGTRSMSLIFDNKKITLAAALFLCFCPYFVMSGRYALDCNLMLCCISCSVLVLLLYLKTGKLHTLLLSGVCFDISLYSYALSYLIIPIFLVLISHSSARNIICMLPVIPLGNHSFSGAYHISHRLRAHVRCGSHFFLGKYKRYHKDYLDMWFLPFRCRT